MSLQYKTDSEKKKAKQRESNLLAFFIGLIIFIMLTGGYIVNSKKYLSKNNLEYLNYKEDVKTPDVIEASLGDPSFISGSRFKEIPEESPDYVFKSEDKPSEEKKDTIDLNFLNSFICENKVNTISLLTQPDLFNKDILKPINTQYLPVVKNKNIDKKMSNKEYRRHILKEYKRIYRK